MLAWRHDEIRNLFGRITNRFIAFLLREGVTKLIVGEAKGWKDEVDIGRVNNQNFVHIPFGSLVKILRYKCEDVGILLVTQDESYTSKASFLDNDFVPDLPQAEGERGETVLCVQWLPRQTRTVSNKRSRIYQRGFERSAEHHAQGGRPPT